MDFQKIAKVEYISDQPIVLAALAAKISQTGLEKSIQELYQEAKNDIESSKNLVNKILQKNKHLIFGDFLPFALIFENVSRFFTLYFWRNVSAPNLIFGAGIEASLRVIKPTRYLPIVSEFGEVAFDFYQRLISEGIENQDARYVLPEGTLTRMIFFTPPRYLMKLSWVLAQVELSEFQEISKKIKNIVKEKFGLEIPKEKPISEWKIWDGGEKIKNEFKINYSGSIFSTYLNLTIEASLAQQAQLVRQRQFFIEIEPAEKIAKRKKFIIPPSFNQKQEKEYRKIANLACQKQRELIRKRDPNFVYFLLMGQAARAKVQGMGPGIIEASKVRCCGTAQWEIRNVFGIPITKKLSKYKELKKEIGPRCFREGICLEPITFKKKFATCPVFLAGWKGKSLIKILDLLKKDYRKFRLKKL